MMREKLKLFLTYIEFFHKLHTKYLQRFSNKIQLMNTHINDDIKFDETVKINKTVNLTDSKGVDNSSLLLSPRMNNASQKSQSPSFLKKSMESVNSLFSVSKTHENQNINLVVDVDKSLEIETLSQQKIDNTFTNIDEICNNVINNSNTPQSFDNFFENPIKDDNEEDFIEEVVKEAVVEENVAIVEEAVEENVAIVEEGVKEIIEENVEEVVKNEEDNHNDDMSVLSLDSAVDDKNSKEKEEPKKKRAYKPRKKN